MKKKNFKSLRLTKKVISNFKTIQVKGQGSVRQGCGPIPSLVDNSNCNSQNGCTNGPDQTMTCQAWGCPFQKEQ